jgi:C-terminal processing protease CtpA/Prc
VVTDILLGTPAAGLDIQLGDRVVAVDGQDVEKLSNAVLWRLISGKDDLALIFHRGDRRVEVRVSVIDLVP